MSDKSITITNAEFEQTVMGATRPVLIDFWAEWCNPCRMLSPTVDQIAEDYKDRVIVGKVNIDEEPELANRFGVMSIPTLIVFNDGNVAAKTVGVVPKTKIAKMLDDVLGGE